MKTAKMSFSNIKDVLSRDEMKEIMAGSGGGCPSCSINGATMGCYTQTVGSKTACRCGLTANESSPLFWC